mgnify:CR=1 FL=1
MQPWPKPVHALSSDQVLQHLQCDGTDGLTDAEAESRRLAVGPNRLVAAPPRPLPLRFLQQFDNPLQLMLLLRRRNFEVSCVRSKLPAMKASSICKQS